MSDDDEEDQSQLVNDDGTRRWAMVCPDCNPMYMCFDSKRMAAHLNQECPHAKPLIQISGQNPVKQTAGSCVVTGRMLELAMQIYEDEHKTDFQCSICQKYFKSNKLFGQHLHITHSKVYKFACQICSRLYKSYDSMKSHLKYHGYEENQDDLEEIIKISKTKCS